MNSLNKIKQCKQLYFYRDLSGNEITELPKDAFYGLKNLTKLDLSINKIEQFPIEALKRVHQLKNLLVFILSYDNFGLFISC